jgi:hypothetical protein
VRIAFALAEETWEAGADGMHSALHVDVPTWIRLQSVAATASHQRITNNLEQFTRAEIVTIKDAAVIQIANMVIAILRYYSQRGSKDAPACVQAAMSDVAESAAGAPKDAAGTPTRPQRRHRRQPDSTVLLRASPRMQTVNVTLKAKCTSAASRSSHHLLLPVRCPLFRATCGHHKADISSLSMTTQHFQRLAASGCSSAPAAHPHGDHGAIAWASTRSRLAGDG